VLLFNSKGQVLLQKRKHKIFDNLWDLTGATHPLHKAEGPASPDGSQGGSDESLEEAMWRCLRAEWDISPTSSGRAGLRGVKEIGVFNYFSRDGKFCENEHCFLMVGEYDGEVNLDQEMGYEYKWMDKKEFLKDIEQNPQDYTPWAIKAVTAHILI